MVNPLGCHIQPDNGTRQHQIALVMLDRTLGYPLPARVDELVYERTEMDWRERMGVEPTEGVISTPQRI